MDELTQAQIGRFWYGMATLELEAKHRFTKLADKMVKAGIAKPLIENVREFIDQEQVHFDLCADLSERFGIPWSPTDVEIVDEVSSSNWSLHDQVLYEVVAFSCVTETVNSSLLTVGQIETNDPQALKATNKILSDEIHHARIGWQFLATHPIDDASAKWLSAYLPVMIAGAMGPIRFQPLPTLGDEELLVHYGAGRKPVARGAFLEGVRSIVLPGLAEVGINVEAGLAYTNDVESNARLAQVAIH